MVQRVSTVAFEGIEARAVDVQVQVVPGLPAFAMVNSINTHRVHGGGADQGASKSAIRERAANFYYPAPLLPAR
jgi:hypothetical protein